MSDKEKNKGGRPSEFDKIDWDVVRKMYENGFTDKEVCRAIRIDESTLTKWKQKKPEFFTSLKDWKQAADAEVERSLFERAKGYSHPDVHISNYQGEITVTELTKHYPPDPTSMIFWLKNRQPDKWRDKSEHTISGIDELLSKRRKTTNE